MTTHIVICIFIYMNIMIYIGKDVQERFTKESNKSGLVNKLLRRFYESGGDIDSLDSINDLPEVAVIRNLDHVREEEEERWAFLEGLVYQRADQRVYDKNTGELYDEAVDKAMIDELIRRKLVV